MGTGIIVCGLNGAGKSTLGKVLAKRLHFHFIDSEYLYFPSINSACVYEAPRTREEAERLLFKEINEHQNFIFASVTGDYGEAVYPFFQYAVWITAPKVVRIERIKHRSFEKFGKRMLSGGDLYEQEKRFFDLARSRSENIVET